MYPSSRRTGQPHIPPLNWNRFQPRVLGFSRGTEVVVVLLQCQQACPQLWWFSEHPCVPVFHLVWNYVLTRKPGVCWSQRSWFRSSKGTRTENPCYILCHRVVYRRRKGNILEFYENTCTTWFQVTKTSSCRWRGRWPFRASSFWDIVQKEGMRSSLCKRRREQERGWTGN